MLLKLPFVLVTGIIAIVALLDHGLQYATAVFEPPCRSAWLAGSQLCSIMGVTQMAIASSTFDNVEVNLSIDRATSIAKSSLSSDSPIVVSLTRAASEFTELAGRQQRLHARADGIRQHILVAETHLHAVLGQCWNTSPLRWICPAALRQRCDEDIAYALLVIATTVKTLMPDLLPAIADVRSTDTRLVAILQDVQDAAAEFHRVPSESIWHGIGLGSTGSAKARLIASVEDGRREGLTYLLRLAEVLHFVESEVTEVCRMIRFVENSPFMTDSTASVIMRNVEAVLGKLMTLSME